MTVFFTIHKNYKLCLQKTNEGIRITRQELIQISEIQDIKMHHGDRFIGRLTAGGVNNQLSNIRQIVFEVTDACNLQCTYCAYGKFYDNYDKRKNQYIDLSKALKLIDFVVEKLHAAANASQHKELIISFYGGEPLLNIDFVREIVTYTQSKRDDRIEFKYNMTTNGIFLKKYIGFLISYDFILTVSLDGDETNNGHRKFHNGKPSFHTVYENVLYIRNNYPNFFKKNVSFNAVLHNRNNEPEVFRFFKLQFDRIPMFSSVNDMGVKSGMQEAFTDLTKQKIKEPDNMPDTEMNQELDLNSAVNKSLQHFIFHYSGNIYRTYNDLLKKTDGTKYIPTATCYPFSKKIFITVNGKILPCERIGHQFALGKVTENGVEINCEEIARKYGAYYDSLQKQCDSCYQAGKCIQCMFIIKNLEQKPVCQGFCNRQKFEDYLQDKMNHLSHSPELYKRIMEEVTVID